MTEKEIKASDEKLKNFNISQTEKCVSIKPYRLIELEKKAQEKLKKKSKNRYFCDTCNQYCALSHAMIHNIYKV